MKFNSILGRYLAKQIVVTFLLVLVTIMGIIMMFDGIEALRRISGREDVGMSYVFEYMITRLPQTVDKVLPFVMMVAAMITFWKISKNSEYVIICNHKSIRSFGLGFFEAGIVSGVYGWSHKCCYI